MKMATTIVTGVVMAAGAWGLSAWAGAGGGMTGGCCSTNHTACPAPATTTAPSTQPTTQSATYICPMDSDVVSDKPGKCPKCGMALVKK